jgi:hypothetical protein
VLEARPSRAIHSALVSVALHSGSGARPREPASASSTRIGANKTTIEQTRRITQRALQQGYAVLAIDARVHGQRRHRGQPHAAQHAMRDMHWFGRRQAYEQMIIDTVRDHRVLLLAGLDERVRAVAALVPPHPGDNVAAVAPINLVAGLQGKRAWLLTGEEEDHGTSEESQALFDATTSQDQKHLHFKSGHLLPSDQVESLSDWFKV